MLPFFVMWIVVNSCYIIPHKIWKYVIYYLFQTFYLCMLNRPIPNFDFRSNYIVCNHIGSYERKLKMFHLGHCDQRFLNRQTRLESTARFWRSFSIEWNVVDSFVLKLLWFVFCLMSNIFLLKPSKGSWKYFVHRENMKWCRDGKLLCYIKA